MNKDNSRYMANLGKEDWNAVNWMFQYLGGTSDYCITFNGNNDSICGYVDLDFVSDLDKRSLLQVVSLLLEEDLLVGCQGFKKQLLYHCLTCLQRGNFVEGSFG